MYVCATFEQLTKTSSCFGDKSHGASKEIQRVQRHMFPQCGRLVACFGDKSNVNEYSLVGETPLDNVGDEWKKS